MLKSVQNYESYFLFELNPLSANLTKMVKHTQIIRRQLPTNYLSVFDHFCEVGA